MKRISMVAVVGSTGLSVLAASAVILGASFALASPDTSLGSVPPPYGVGDAKIDRGLDLPIGEPVAVDPLYTKYVLQSALPELGQSSGGPAEDPRDEPPPVFFGEEIQADKDSIIYVIDNSGSMTITVEPFTDETGAIRRGNRLDRAKAELRRSIMSLPESFEFNVMFYDECVMACFPSKQRASSSAKQAAIGWIAQVQPDGWTNTGLAVATALGDKENKAVVLLSDGSPNFLDCAMNYVGSFEQHRGMIRNTNSQGARIDCFGIGISSDADARSFMQSVAAENAGSYVEIN